MQKAMKNAKSVDFRGAAFLLTPFEQGWLDSSGLARTSASPAPPGCEPSCATGAPPPSRQVAFRSKSDFIVPTCHLVLLRFSKMDSMRRKALGRSLPKRGKDRREPRSDAFARRQSELQVPKTPGPLLRLTCSFDLRG